MGCVVVGPGLLGSYLGIAAEAQAVITGSSGRCRAFQARLPNGLLQRWQPEVLTWDRLASNPSPRLVTTRIPQTPTTCHQAQASDHWRRCQNGYATGNTHIVPFLAIDQNSDGSLSHHGQHPRLVMRSSGAAWQACIEAWRSSGIHIDITDDLRPAAWEKLLLNVTVGPLCLAHNTSMPAIWQDTDLRHLCLAVIAEGCLHAPWDDIDQPDPEHHQQRADEFFKAIGDHHPSVVSDACELPFLLAPLQDIHTRAAAATPAIGHLLDVLSPHVHEHRAGIRHSTVELA